MIFIGLNSNYTNLRRAIWRKRSKMPFLSELVVKKIGDKRWELKEELKYQPLQGHLITVPIGFRTNFASVPRIPIAFLLAGDTAQKSATVHDYLYSGIEHRFSRKRADEILLQAMKEEGLWWWRRSLMWIGVRWFGGFFFEKPKK